MSKISNRRQFLAALATGTTSLATAHAFGSIPATATRSATTPTPHQFIIPPYLQALTPTGVSLLSITSRPAYTWIMYGKEQLSDKAHAVEDGMVQANNTLSSIRIADLQPDTVYYYQVISKEIISFAPYKLEYGEEIKSEIYTFRTPKTDADTVSALVLNDIHDRPESYATMFRLAHQLPYEFVVLNGDLFNYQTDEKQVIEHLLHPCTELFASEKPFVLNRGNHETRGRFARNLKQYFDYLEGKYYQAFRQGPIFWIMLDTGEDKPDDEPVYAGIVDYDNYRKEQATWLEQVMQTKDYQQAPFKVVVMHIPPFHSGDWHGTLHCRELFSPLFDKYQVDVVLSGHTHRYGIYKPQPDHTYHIVIGGSPKEGNRTMTHVAADRKSLTINMIKDDGSNVGTVALSKKKR
ncbi:metallophosphoesterase family protein [Sphingobacterium phlebotomi]|nr:metallophosphoesterase [Sphingobacterium phlebotomi]